ncbi:putative TetR family transcriptional regulator [Gordonia effusa NBRC 100432]|uniref:Putative TetR family transcriptional regulator n=1 Tax=Gordonia effusa NBRC 100432 TaxID=1077974 RepID=H0R159_9ACTN|nr:TetR family transcriptional regulator [Gordonia effusa]GAB18810.1 putative TetR family transcriptional regulator [Gordonia effusa NBRC 100432]
MANSRRDVLDAARALLQRTSLGDLSMRRLATELGVRPNALYWHFPNKQTLLAALGDDILASIAAPDTSSAWDERLTELAVALRNRLLSVTDSAELVSSSWASGLSEMAIADVVWAAASSGGLSDADAHAVTTAICQLTIGLTIEEQTRIQMERLGVAEPSGRDFTGEFDAALRVVVDGARHRAAIGTSAVSVT